MRNLRSFTTVTLFPCRRESYFKVDSPISHRTHPPHITLPTMIVPHCCSLLEATTIFFRLPFSMRILRRTSSIPRQSPHTSCSQAAATTPAGRLAGKMSQTSRLIGHLFLPPANSIDSVKEGGEFAALESLDVTHSLHLRRWLLFRPRSCHSWGSSYRYAECLPEGTQLII